MSQTKVEEKVKKFNETVKGLGEVFVRWAEQEEARLQRELTDEEMDLKITEVDSKIKELMNNGHGVSAKFEDRMDMNGAGGDKVEVVTDEDERKIRIIYGAAERTKEEIEFLKAEIEKVDKFYEATKVYKLEFAQWTEQEEERLQRELTDEEMDVKLDELRAKYNVKYDKVDRFYEAVSTHDDEAMEWIDREEERLQRELTDEEIGVIADKIREKYNIRYEN